MDILVIIAHIYFCGFILAFTKTAKNFNCVPGVFVFMPIIESYKRDESLCEFDF